MHVTAPVADRDVHDLVVLGSGAAGLTAALTAALEGLRVLVLDHAAEVGGTSARSSGSVWIPDSHVLRAQGVQEDGARAARYLSALVGPRGTERMWRTFLHAGPRMVSDLEERAGIGFVPMMNAPDYRQDCAGAAPGGRALAPLPFDGRTLGASFALLGWPLPELMLFGGMMITRPEAAELLRFDRSPRAALLGLRLVGRYLRDRLRHARGTRLVLGNALVARLLKAGLDHGVEVRTSVAPVRLLSEGGRISGVTCVAGDAEVTFRARRGVVLAGGGFPASAEWRAREMPKPTPPFTPAAPGCDGSTLTLGVRAGGCLGPSGRDNALWFPSSVARRRDGSMAVYPHIVLDRAKPGLMAVDGSGRRFINEALSYHEFVRGMYASGDKAIPAWLICDRAFVRRYGLGLIRPRTPFLRKYVKSGYLRQARSIPALANAIGVPAGALADSVARHNGFAQTGIDTDFGKGGTIYERGNGDPDVGPNPCIGPIAKAPFCAIAVWPTPLGTSRGLIANGAARVLGQDGAPIAGLYVCGNDMQSVFGGEYPGAGAQLGQAMTFGWIAARHAAGVVDATPPDPSNLHLHEVNTNG